MIRARRVLTTARRQRAQRRGEHDLARRPARSRRGLRRDELACAIHLERDADAFTTHELRDLGVRERRQIQNLFFATRATALALAAEHAVPRFSARLGDVDHDGQTARTRGHVSLYAPRLREFFAFTEIRARRERRRRDARTEPCHFVQQLDIWRAGNGKRRTASRKKTRARSARGLTASCICKKGIGTTLAIGTAARAALSRHRSTWQRR